MIRIMPRSPLMAEKLGRALKIEPAKPFIHPKSKKNLKRNEPPNKSRAKPELVASPPPPIPTPTPPPPPPVVHAEPPKPRRHPQIEGNAILRNQLKDRKNILATELEGYRRQESRLQSELAEVQRFIELRKEEVRAIEEKVSFLDMSDQEYTQLETYLGAFHRGPSIPGRLTRDPNTISTKEVIEYIETRPGQDITLDECREHFGSHRCRDLAVRFNYVTTALGKTVRVRQGVYRLAPTQ